MTNFQISKVVAHLIRLLLSVDRVKLAKVAGRFLPGFLLELVVLLDLGSLEVKVSALLLRLALHHLLVLVAVLDGRLQLTIQVLRNEGFKIIEGSIAQWSAYLLTDLAAPGSIPSVPDVDTVNQRRRLEESVRCLENVNTNLVLATQN